MHLEPDWMVYFVFRHRLSVVVDDLHGVSLSVTIALS